MVTILAAVFGATMAGWFSNKNLAQRVDDLRSDLDRRLDGVLTRLDRIDRALS
jgi:hypothetical protein